MKIITLTLNPAYDIHCYVDNLKLLSENLAERWFRCVGGKGINISRALNVLGDKSVAIVSIPGSNARPFEDSLVAEGVDFRAIPCSGEIRENVTVHTKNGEETRISSPGFFANDSMLSSALDIISAETSSDNNCIVTFTGRVPRGITHKGVMEFLTRIKGLGASLVIDSNSVCRDDIISLSPWLVKPNEEEVERYIGKWRDERELIKRATELCAHGVENVLVTLGARGAILIMKDGILRAEVPQINAISTIGAGDSCVAGFVSARSDDAEERLRTALALGTAACLAEGTSAPRRYDFESIKSQIIVKNL